MNDEIKEILEDLRNKNMSVDDLTHNDKTKLLDYITNLQKENETLNSRINKAIEYINKNKHLNWYVESIFTDELLKILKGSDKDENN